MLSFHNLLWRLPPHIVTGPKGPIQRESIRISDLCGSCRVLTCLFEKEVEFQLIRVENFNGLEKRPEYLKLQPNGQALTYEEGLLTLVDSRAIIRHISEKYANQGTKNLLGSGGLERASIEQWLQTEASSFDPPSSALVFHLAFPPPREEPETNGAATVKQSKLELERALDIYEQRLEEAAYLAGDRFSLADLSHLPNAHRLVTSVPECASMFESRRRVSRWWEAISGRASWRSVAEMQKERESPPPAAAEGAPGIESTDQVGDHGIMCSG